MELSDFPRSFIAVVLPWDSQHGPRHHLLMPIVGSPGSRAGSLRTWLGSLITQGPTTSRDNDEAGVAFHLCEQRRHPKVYKFIRSSIARPARPLSTLRPYPCGYTRMTRSQCGSLTLHCMELSSTTSRWFYRRTHKLFRT